MAPDDHRPPTLDDAVAGLYLAFAQARRRGPVEGCPCCVRRGDQATLGHTPRRTLTADQLGSFAFRAMSTWGDEDDYRHFLPRILELALTPEGARWPGMAAEHVCLDLAAARWSTWTAPERAAVTRFFEAAWATALRSGPGVSTWSVDALPSGLPWAFDDVSPFLEQWERDTSLAATVHLAATLHGMWWHAQLRPRSRSPAGVSVIRRWLVAPARRDALARAFEAHLDEPVAGELAEGIDAWGGVQPDRP